MSIASQTITDLPVDVHWPGYDPDGQERSSERSRYLIRLDDSGRPRIRFALALASSTSRSISGG